MNIGRGMGSVLGLVAVFLTALTGPASAGWNEYVAHQFPNAVSFDPSTIGSDQPFVLEDGKTTVIRHTGPGTLRFPHGLFVVANSQLVIEENTNGLEILTPFIIVENGGALLAGGPEATNRFTSRLTFTLTGVGNETSEDQGIDDPQIYSLYDLVDGKYQRSARKPGDKDPQEKESSLFGNKVIGAGPGGRIDLFGSKGSKVSWARLAASIDVDQGLNKNLVVLDGNLVGEWAVGDRIAVSTSDFEPDHTEEGLIQSVQTVQNGNGFQTQLTIHQIRHGVTGTLTGGGTDVWKDGPGTSFQWSHYGKKESAVNADIRASVALLTRNITIRSYRTEDAPRDALATKVLPVVDNLGATNYVRPDGTNIPAGNQFFHQEYYPGKFGDPLSRTSNRRDIYGGHTLFRLGSTVRLMGVEFTMLGQPGNFGRIGRYPVHFHLMKEATNSFVSSCSISDSFNRWITVHGTFALGLTNNVGYRSFGHGFYIEDGVEQGNVFDSNCGILARAVIPGEYDFLTDPTYNLYPQGKPAAAPSGVKQMQPFWNPHDVYPLTFLDRENPSVFWISNKQNHFRNNVAAGAAMAGQGFWLVGLAAERRDGPAWGAVTNDAALVAKFPYISGQFAPVLEFYGNTAQSCWTGFGTAYDAGGLFNYGRKDPLPALNNWDTTPRFAYDADRNADDLNYFVVNAGPKALTDGKPPTDKSPSAIDMMARSTAFRNRQYGAWLRPFWWWVANSQFVDNVFGATLVSGGNEEASPAGFWGLVNNTDFVGFSDNLYRNQSRAKIQEFSAIPSSLTDRNPVLTYNADFNQQFAYPEVNKGISRNVFGGGDAKDKERRGYQFYDGPGPVLSGVSFHGFYPTVDNSFPGNAPFAKPQYDWNPQQWATNFFTPFYNETNRFSRTIPFLNAAIGWFGPGNQWKYSALTWTEKLFFDPNTTILRHLVHDNYTFYGGLSDGDGQTFILDTDGSLQSFRGAGSVNSWNAHRGRDWAYECRSAFSCIASPYHYGNTDIIIPGGITCGLVFGKLQSDFLPPTDEFTNSDIRHWLDDHRYFIKGFNTKGEKNMGIYGTLNAAGTRYTIQFRQTSDRSTTRNNAIPPPAQFGIRFTSLEATPGRNSMGYAVAFPEGTQPGSLNLSAALAHVHQGYDNVPAQTFANAWESAIDPSATHLPVSTTPNTVSLASGTVTTAWDPARNMLLLTVTNTQPRSRKAYPLGLCADASQTTFIGTNAVARWTKMVPLMEEVLTEDRYAREPFPLTDVFERIAKSLNDSPDSGAIIVAVRYPQPPVGTPMPDILTNTPTDIDETFYDKSASDLHLKPNKVAEYECYLAINDSASYGLFRTAYFRNANDGGPDDDPDLDGLTNLEEYWWGSNPRASVGVRHPVTAAIRNYDGRPYLTLNFRRPSGDRDLNFAVFTSEDLVTWEEDEAAHEREVLDNGDGSESVLLRVSRHAESTPTRFVRLRVTLRE